MVSEGAEVSSEGVEVSSEGAELSYERAGLSTDYRGRLVENRRDIFGLGGGRLSSEGRTESSSEWTGVGSADSVELLSYKEQTGLGLRWWMLNSVRCGGKCYHRTKEEHSFGN